jgi:inositol-phosphate phosphatase / L-galactose 1-phosphate phosphatase / histidinol-phosphatase
VAPHTSRDAAPCPPELIEFAGRLADAAGEVIRQYFRQPFDIITKADESPVTIADRQSERVMRDLIEATYPDHGIMGEEHGTVRGNAEYVWYLDPIDGTKSFISGVPLFGTLIGLAQKDGDIHRPWMGVIDQAISGERWMGAPGHGTTFNGQPAHVRSCPSVSDAIMFTTSPEYFEGERLSQYQRVEDTAHMTRYGTDCYAFAILSSGHIDLIVEAGLNEYDYCAVVPVIENAGGIVTDWSGRAKTLDGENTIVAAGDVATHAETLRILAG